MAVGGRVGHDAIFVPARQACRFTRAQAVGGPQWSAHLTTKMLLPQWPGNHPSVRKAGGPGHPLASRHPVGSVRRHAQHTQHLVRCVGLGGQPMLFGLAHRSHIPAFKVVLLVLFP